MSSTNPTKLYFEVCDSVYETWKAYATTYLTNSKAYFDYLQLAKV